MIALTPITMQQGERAVTQKTATGRLLGILGSSTQVTALREECSESAQLRLKLSQLPLRVVAWRP